ncbi:MAG: hypothetical protein UY35_C0008G0006 [Candidatus Saccharibacteria bacterium GW2011_GWC2_48_9]|nr:MAG: hypothetical protein UY35_C0008G0006 [Candidatus Saccharibacteria bacterium GW2011_GWC2_48_9]
MSMGRGASASAGVEIVHPSGGATDTSVVVVTAAVAAETVVSPSLLLHPVVTATHATNDRVAMTLPFLPMDTIIILKIILCQVL